MQEEWEELLRAYVARCAQDERYLQHLGRVLALQSCWGIARWGRREGPSGFEYQLQWGNPHVMDSETAHMWLPRSVLEQHMPRASHVQLLHVDARAEGQPMRRAVDRDGLPTPLPKIAGQEQLRTLRWLSSDASFLAPEPPKGNPINVLSGGEEASAADNSWAELVHGLEDLSCSDRVVRGPGGDETLVDQL